MCSFLTNPAGVQATITAWVPILTLLVTVIGALVVKIKQQISAIELTACQNQTIIESNHKQVIQKINAVQASTSAVHEFVGKSEGTFS